MGSNRLTQYNLLTAAGLQDLILLPESEAYKDHQISYWAANAPLRPTCIVQPRSTEGVYNLIWTCVPRKYRVMISSL
jgi:hypothetical protein